MRAGDLEGVEDVAYVVGRAGLRVAVGLVGHVGRRVTPGVVGDTAVRATEMSDLRGPAARVAGELVDEQDRWAGAGLLDVERDAVVGGYPRADGR